MPDTRTLRIQALAARRDLPRPYRHAASQRICEQVVDLPQFQKANRMALFLSLDDEVNVRPLLEKAWLLARHTYVPWIAGPRQPLQFREHSRSTPLVRNRFGIDEPDPALAPLIPPADLDLVLVPLAAFDARCHRIGMGAGYYDRTFAFRLSDSTPRPWLVGVAFAAQQVREIKPQAWDVPLDMIVSESQVWFREQGAAEGPP